MRVDSDATGFGNLPRFDWLYKTVSVPHFMAYVNSKVVRRSQFLNRPLNRIAYSESMSVPALLEACAWFLPFWVKGQAKLNPPQGEGPGLEIQKAGGYAIRITASNPNIGSVELTGAGSGDPGYAHTSRILAEVGLCLLDNDCIANNGGGVRTVASSVKPRELRDRLGRAKGQAGDALLKYEVVGRKGKHEVGGGEL